MVSGQRNWRRDAVRQNWIAREAELSYFRIQKRQGGNYFFNCDGAYPTTILVTACTMVTSTFEKQITLVAMYRITMKMKRFMPSEWQESGRKVTVQVLLF
jgi:hypothetical protein